MRFCGIVNFSCKEVINELIKCEDELPELNVPVLPDGLVTITINLYGINLLDIVKKVCGIGLGVEGAWDNYI